MEGFDKMKYEREKIIIIQKWIKWQVGVRSVQVRVVGVVGLLALEGEGESGKGVCYVDVAANVSSVLEKVRGH
jgi:hypothetical protein